MERSRKTCTPFTVTNNTNEMRMTTEELITKQQLKIEEYKSAAKENKTIVHKIKSKFYAIGQPLNDNALQFNAAQRKWCFEVMELIESINL